jgi:hypothetical protein
MVNILNSTSLVFLAVRYTAKLADGTIFEKEGFGDELYEFVTDEGILWS